VITFDRNAQATHGPPEMRQPPSSWLKEVDQPYAKEFHLWRRRLTKTALDDATRLYDLKIEPIGGEAQAGDRAGLRHIWNPPAENKAFLDEDVKLQEMVRIYNERAQALQVLREMNGVVSMGRILAANWNRALAEETFASSAAAETNRVTALDRLRQIEREIAANRASRSIDQHQQISREMVDGAERDLQKAVAEARANSWRSDVMMLLQVAQTSVQTWRFIDSLLPSADMKARRSRRFQSNRSLCRRQSMAPPRSRCRIVWMQRPPLTPQSTTGP
jgi:hypothetical protein